MTNEIQTQIYSGMWIRLPIEVKKRIAEIFGIKRSGASHVVDGMVQSDGYTDNDLSVLTIVNLQKELGSTDPDIFSLWNTMIKRTTEELTPKTVEVKEEKPNVEMNIKIDGEEVKLSGVTTKKNAKTKKS